MQPFVAIDFETANEKRASACSVGLARFDEHGKCVDTFHTFIEPHPDLSYFNPVNTWIHGITANDVMGAPTWDEVHGQVLDFIADAPLVAHNMAFDGYVLSDLAEIYGLEPLTNRRLCTVRLSRRILADVLSSRKLHEVYGHYFPGEEFTHHDAGEDAIAAGRLFARMQQDRSYDDLCELCPPAGARRSRPSRRTLDRLAVEELLKEYGGSNSLSGEQVCITGTLQHGKRADIQELITSLGGVPDKSVTKNTTMLVVGIPNPGSWSEGSSASRKLNKADELRAAGSPIRALTEEEFFLQLKDVQE